MEVLLVLEAWGCGGVGRAYSRRGVVVVGESVRRDVWEEKAWNM